MKIFVSGLVNIETTVAVRGFPISYYPIDFNKFGISSNVSGVGYNLAKALTTLGDEAELHSFIGSDEEAERILSRMGKDGVDSTHIARGLMSTPVSAVLYAPDGKRQIYCDLKDIQDQVIEPDSVKDGLSSCGAAILCNIAFNRGLIKAAHDAGVTTATDVHVLADIDDEYNRGFMENADILFLSDEKLPCPAQDFIRQLQCRYHNRIIVIGMGAEGAMLLDSKDDEIRMIPAYTDIKVVNTVGAGDALFSSFMHFWMKGLGAYEALKRAVIFAGVKTEVSGASKGFITEDDVEKRLTKSKG